jgi:ABC-type phosphate transport system substrate-binding protein
MARKSFYPLLAFVLALAAPSPAQEGGFKVVVNAANPATSMSPAALSDLFLKKTTSWPHGVPALAVDQSAASGVRDLFSRKVHARGVDAVQNYWQQRIFSGRGTPPPVKLSDAEVLEFVKSRPGAVGYVSNAAALVDGVKALKLAE